MKLEPSSETSRLALPLTGLTTTVDLTSGLEAEYVRPSRLSLGERMSMYALMRHYYADITESQFTDDLMEKTHVILLRDDRGEIRGFSTLLVGEISDLKTKPSTVRYVFSGDTVVDKAYWGQKQLGIAFLKYLFFEKLKNPFKPVYWMLMSKGYRTYLLMANNFSEHFPRFEQAIPPHAQEIMDRFYSNRFGDAYDKQSGLVVPDGPSCRLRGGVAAVEDELRSKFPRVDFFAKRNPNWADGVELACIAKMTLAMPFYYFIKKTVRR